MPFGSARRCDWKKPYYQNHDCFNDAQAELENTFTGRVYGFCGIHANSLLAIDDGPWISRGLIQPKVTA